MAANGYGYQDGDTTFVKNPHLSKKILIKHEIFFFFEIDTMKLKSTQLPQKHLTLQVTYIGVGD